MVQRKARQTDKQEDRSITDDEATLADTTNINNESAEGPMGALGTTLAILHTSAMISK